ALAILVAATAGIDAVYLSNRASSLPLKFLIPGTLFMVCFQIVPIIYTFNVAFTNYSIGHVVSKPDAIQQIQLTSLEPPASGKVYNMAPARNSGGALVLLLQDQTTGKTFVGTGKGLTPLAKADVTSGALGITAAKGFTIIKGQELFSMDKELRSLHVPIGGGREIEPQTISTAAELQPTLRYDSKTDTFRRISDGAVFRDNGKGSFVHGAQEL